jgi:MFS family permease
MPSSAIKEQNATLSQALNSHAITNFLILDCLLVYSRNMPSLAPRSYQLLVGVFASLGAFLFGYDLGVIAAVVASETFKSQFDPNTSEEGLVVSMFTAGAFFGAGAGGTLGDRIGRRGTIVVGAIVFLLGGGLQTGARNIHFLWTGRFISGLGVGVLCMIVPLYQAELAHPHIRGRITALQQLMIGIGAFIATWVGWACFVELGSSSAQWRVPLAIQNVPAIFLAALTYLFPESPRYLVFRTSYDYQCN